MSSDEVFELRPAAGELRYVFGGASRSCAYPPGR
jgi:hypothetical protein